MSKKDAFIQFLKAARSLQNQGLSKEAILQFAKNEFGEISEFFKKQIDNLFKKKGIEKIPVKDDVFDSTVIKLPIDDTGVPFNPNNPLKNYGKSKEGIETVPITGQMEKIEKQMDKINKANSRLDELIKEREAVFKPRFKLNVEKFKKDFNVADEEIEKILKLSPDEQQETLQKYIDKDFKERIELADYDITNLEPNAEGGRAGYYGGGQAIIEPSLSDVGHGSDALMARTRFTAPGSQATTSTGLNYLLGEDNDDTRVPFNQGLLVPEPKPYTPKMFEEDSMTLLKGMYGTGPESNPMFYNKIIEKGNILRKQGVDRKTVIEIIRNNKDKINAFLETQTTSPKTFEGLESFEMKANGGRIGLKDGLNFDKAYEKILEKETEEDKNILEEGKKELEKKGIEQAKLLYETKPTRNKFLPGRQGDKEYELALTRYYETEKGKKEKEDEMFKMATEFQTLKKKGILRPNETFRNFKNMKTFKNVKNKILELNVKYPEKKIINDEGFIDEKKLKEAMDESEIDLEISLDGLTLKRFINTEGEQSATSGSFDIGNLNFSSSDIEGGQLTTTGSFNLQDVQSFKNSKFPNVDVTGKIISRDGDTLGTEYSFNYDNEALTGKLTDSDGIKTTEFNLNKNFTLPKKFKKNLELEENLKLKKVIDKFDFGAKGNYDITSSDGQTNTNYDLVPKLSYNDGIFSADLSKSILEGGDDFSLNAAASFPLFEKTFDGALILDEFGRPIYNEKNKKYERETPNTEDMGILTLKATDLFTDNMDGLIGYRKNIYDKDNLKFSIGGEMSPFSGEKTGGAFLKYTYADGGIAGLRPGYSQGKKVGVDFARRGFLKVLGATAAGVAAFKSGVLKVLGKTSTSKAIPKIVEIGKDAGAPAWFEPMVNKVLADGLDITKKNAYVDGQTVKRLDTPNGKVDVYHNERTGEIDVDYMGSGTALDEGVQMNYKPGLSLADEGTKGTPADEFMATENIPEGQVVGPDDYEIGLGENTVGDVKNLYSDTLELEKLGGQNPLIQDISNSINKKRKLKQMKENPSDFVTDVQGDYDPT